MARISVADAQAWVEATKFTVEDPFTQADADLLEQIETEVLAFVSSAYDTSTWVDRTTTPHLVRVAIAKKFVAWAYRRQYSESLADDDAVYARELERNADAIITGIVDGTVDIPAPPTPSHIGPVFYPTDASSAMEPTTEDPSLGPAKFSMGMTFYYNPAHMGWPL